MRIPIISVGKKPNIHLLSLIAEYEKRLNRYQVELDWRLIPSAGTEPSKAITLESGSILANVKPNDFVIVLDELGLPLNSPGLAERIEEIKRQSRRPVFIVGGAHGVNDAVRERADLLWSISPLVFPHQLVKLLLAEQIYRASTITAGGAYHHD